MKAPEKSKVTINGYGAIHAETLEEMSSFLHLLDGYVVHTIDREGKRLLFGRYAKRDIEVLYSTDAAIWFASLHR